MHGTPFALRSARLSPPFCSLCYLKSPVRLSIHYRRSISTEHRALQTLPNTVRGGHSAHPSSGPPISWWTSAPSSHLNHTSACIHRSIPPSRLPALEYLNIMTLKPFPTLAPLNSTSDWMGPGSVMAPLRWAMADSRDALALTLSSALHAHAAVSYMSPSFMPHVHCYRSCVSPHASTIPQRSQTAV